MSTSRSLSLAAIACAAATGIATPSAVSAQLISPGKLSTAHQELEGVGNCTNCHQLRTRGITNGKCLDCHTPMQQRIEQHAGLHARTAEQNCGDCHKEHFGRDMDIVRFDTTAVKHDRLEFPLTEAHGTIGCRDCHTPRLIVDPRVRDFKSTHGALAKTFLGLGTTCAACHTDDDPHNGQFAGRPCDDCHTAAAWRSADLFDHERSRYRLTGLHRRVDCGDCHASRRDRRGDSFTAYRPLRFDQCSTCHDDVHSGTMQGACSDCHTPAGWNRISRSTFERRFDHAATHFALVGKHADAECGACHAAPPPQNPSLHIRLAPGSQRRAYPLPEASGCADCHVDYHNDAFAASPGGVSCDNCHGQRDWYPATYDLARHNRESSFALDGAHATLPCAGCHDNVDFGHDGLTFRFAAQDCASCHRPDDPHRDQFAAAACDECHDNNAFTITGFDHDRTRYPLDGEHRPVPCASCHEGETDAAGNSFVRYKPLGTRCRDCHGDGR